MTSQSEIAFAQDARLFIIDDEGVVFSEGSQKMFALNTAATQYWLHRAAAGMVPEELQTPQSGTHWALIGLAYRIID